MKCTFTPCHFCMHAYMELFLWAWHNSKECLIVEKHVDLNIGIKILKLFVIAFAVNHQIILIDVAVTQRLDFVLFQFYIDFHSYCYLGRIFLIKAAYKCIFKNNKESSNQIKLLSYSRGIKGHV